MRGSYKLGLLRSAARKGIRPFADQLVRSVRDRLWSAHHVVLVYDVANKGVPSVPQVRGLEFATANQWMDLSEAERLSLEGIDSATVEWGEAAWFDLGWKLWVGRLDGHLAVTVWWRTPEQSKDFFVPLPEHSILLWQSTTLPRLRGRGLYTAALASLMVDRRRAGVTRFYINCRDYNFPSRRTMQKIGFDMIGFASDNRFSGRRRWTHLSATAGGNARQPDGSRQA